MKFEIRTLENTPIEEIMTTFNLSFLNSIVPFQLSKQEFDSKMINDSICLELSAGAFFENKLIGFILYGKTKVANELLAYNGGTGVDPDFRGNKIIAKLYDFILPIIKKTGVTKCQHEVITENSSAIKIYKSIGFTITRELNCFNGIITKKNEKYFKVKVIKSYDWENQKSFWDILPSWQNDCASLNNSLAFNKSFGVFEENYLVGYIVYNPLSNKIQQLAVHPNHRRKGIGSQLLQHISDDTEFKFINIDASSIQITTFLENSGFKIGIKQYEMSLKL